MTQLAPLVSKKEKKMETPQAPEEKKKNSKLIYIIIGIVVICLGCIAISAILGFFVLPNLTPEPTATPLPTNTPIPPTAPPPPTAAPENTPASSEGTSQQEGDSCVYWKAITRALEGERLCVYGEVYKTYNTNEAWRIDFGPEKNSFFMYDTKYYYNVEVADCVMAEGTIKSISGVPYLNIENKKLYFCQK